MNNALKVSIVAAAFVLASCGAAPASNSSVPMVDNANGLPKNLSNTNISIDKNTNMDVAPAVLVPGTGSTVPANMNTNN